MKNIFLKPFTKVREDMKRQIRWSRMSEIDRNILRAEESMIRAHARWQSLLAAKKADEMARIESHNLIMSEYERFNFEITEEND